MTTLRQISIYRAILILQKMSNKTINSSFLLMKSLHIIRSISCWHPGAAMREKVHIIMFSYSCNDSGWEDIMFSWDKMDIVHEVQIGSETWASPKTTKSITKVNLLCKQIWHGMDQSRCRPNIHKIWPAKT